MLECVLAGQYVLFLLSLISICIFCFPTMHLSTQNMTLNIQRQLIHQISDAILPQRARPLLCFLPFKAHCHLIKFGNLTDTYTWNNILTHYCRCRDIVSAQKLFDEIPQRDTISWNCLIAGHVFNNNYEQAYVLFRKMLQRGILCDQYTLGSVLKSVACTNNLATGFQVHSFVIKTGLDNNVFSGTALVDMYAKCDRLNDAHFVFMSIPDHNAISWNAMVWGFAQAGDAKTAFSLFNQMGREGLNPDEASFASILPLLNDPKRFKVLIQIHGKIVKFGWVVGTIVYNAAITAYSESGSLQDSEKIFADIDDGIKDLVTWNSMIAAYADHGFTKQALKLFMIMQQIGIVLDVYTFTSVISALHEYAHIIQGRTLHGLVIKNGIEGWVPVSNALIGMYIRSGNTSMEDAVKCFNLMELRDIVSWNSILTGLSQRGLNDEALHFFCHMRSVSAHTNHYAFSATLRSCSELAFLQLSQQIHGLVLKSGFASNDFVSSALIYMYTNCGVIRDARKSFDESCKESSVPWNSIIFGYAQHGQGVIALNLFQEMQEMGVEPNHITFVGLLSACSHSGLVEEGFKILKAIQPAYGISLRMEHYACGVDLFGRAGRLDEALKLVESMPFGPDFMVWMTLLGACRLHRNIELAGLIGKHLLELEPAVHSTYVILSNMYTGFGNWDARAMIQRAMRDRGVIKVPGCSWIELDKKVHSFNAEDRSHPQSADIYESLAALMEEVDIEGHGWMHPR